MPGAGQALVEVAATSFNPVDVSIRAGYLKDVFPVEFPHIPGVDVAGTIVELGAGVSEVSPGDKVIGFLPMDKNGAAADLVLAPAAILARAPSVVALGDAAAMPAAGLTAWQALFEHGDIKAGQRVLVNGAGGGVGGFAVQFAKWSGAFVIATASERSKTAVRALGADQIVDYTGAKLSEQVVEPVDVVVSVVTADEAAMSDLVGLVRPGGVIVTTATPAQPDVVRNVRTVAMRVHSDAAQLGEITDLVDSGRVHLDVSARYPLTDTSRVHELGAAGKLRGKVILLPGS